MHFIKFTLSVKVVSFINRYEQRNASILEVSLKRWIEVKKFQRNLGYVYSKYKVIQEERSLFWEVIVLVIVWKKVQMNMWLILNGYWDTTVWIWCSVLIGFLLVGLDEERTLQKKGRYMRWIACLHFGCCLLHKEMWRLTRTNNTWYSPTSCKTH